MKRIFLIVLDSVGAGALPDAAAYGDAGANTLGHIIEQAHPHLPNMEAMGLGFDVLKSVKGLGIKTAQKIIVELRDKIGAVCPANEALPLRQAADGTFDEALSALTMLGFARQASEKVLRALRKEMPAATVEELVRQALKRL